MTYYTPIKKRAPKKETIAGRLLKHTGFKEWMNNGPNPTLIMPNGATTNRPAPFYKCDVCERYEGHVEFIHNGKFKVCFRHMRGSAVDRPASLGDEWMDVVQLMVAENIVRELMKNA